MIARLLRTTAAAALVFGALCAGGVAAASAANFGQLGLFGEYGIEDGKLSNPQIFGAEPNGSVYVGDEPNEYHSFRIQKFSPDGTLEGAVTIETPLEEVFEGIAVDPAKGRFYLLRDREKGDGVTSQALSEEIMVFSTTPTAGKKLVAPTGGPATLSVPDGESPGGPLSIDNPTQLALDPHNGDLEILGSDRSGHQILQRIGTSGAGSIGPRYTETSDGKALSESEAGITIGPDGTTYIVRGGQNATHPTGFLFTLPPTLEGRPVAVPAFSEIPGDVPTTSVVGPGYPGYGPQIAISRDGEVLYYRRIRGRSTPVEPSTVEVVGYSLPEDTVRVLYGGAVSGGECRIQTTYGSLATVDRGLVALDPGAPDFGPPTFGEHVIELGAGGSGCPAPSTSLALKAASQKVSSVPRGTSVDLDGRGSELGEFAEGIESATWTIEGPEGRIVESVDATDPADLTLSHTFYNAGSYTVRFAVKFKLKKSVENNGSEGAPGGEPSVYSAPPQTLTVTGASAEAPPTISGLAPPSGPAGGENVVTISGARFKGEPTVKFGTVPGTEVKVVSANTLTVAAPAGVAGKAVDVSVRTADGITPRSSADRYIYESGGGSGPGGSSGTVTGVSPSHGPAAGGNVVTISGTGLDGASKVKFGNASSTEVTAVDSSTVTAKVPPGAQGSTVDVVVVNSSGGASAVGPGDAYRYDALMQGLGVVKIGNGSGTVTSASGGISCGIECSAAFPQGATVVLSAAAGPGSSFAGWGGACSGQGPCVVGMTSTKGVTANFEATKPPPAGRAAPIAPAPAPPPKKLKCKAGTKLKKVGGKGKCVKVQTKHPKKHGKRKKHKGKHGKKAKKHRSHGR